MGTRIEQSLPGVAQFRSTVRLQRGVAMRQHATALSAVQKRRGLHDSHLQDKIDAQSVVPMGDRCRGLLYKRVCVQSVRHESRGGLAGRFFKGFSLQHNGASGLGAELLWRLSMRVLVTGRSLRGCGRRGRPRDDLELRGETSGGARAGSPQLGERRCVRSVHDLVRRARPGLQRLGRRKRPTQSQSRVREWRRLEPQLERFRVAGIRHVLPAGQCLAGHSALSLGHHGRRSKTAGVREAAGLCGLQLVRLVCSEWQRHCESRGKAQQHK